MDKIKLHAKTEYKDDYYKCHKCKTVHAYAKWRRDKTTEGNSICPKCKESMPDTSVRKVRKPE
jgi:uncharacterized CHY-type Zn-finger protein